MDTWMQDIISNREKQLLMALIIKERLNKKSEENIPTLIEIIKKELSSNLNKVDFNDGYVSSELNVSSVRDYSIEFIRDLEGFKEYFSSYIDLSDIELSDTFIKMIISSKEILKDFYVYFDDNPDLVFNLDVLKDVLSFYNIDLELSEEDRMIVKTRIPTLSSVARKQLIIK